MIVDYQQTWSVPFADASDEEHFRKVAALDSPYREGITQKFSRFISRIGYPDVDERFLVLVTLRRAKNSPPLWTRNRRSVKGASERRDENIVLHRPECKFFGAFRIRRLPNQLTKVRLGAENRVVRMRPGEYGRSLLLYQLVSRSRICRRLIPSATIACSNSCARRLPFIRTSGILVFRSSSCAGSLKILL